MSLSNQKGNSVKGQFAQFNGSNDITVWQYNMGSLLRALGLYNYVQGTARKPLYWTIDDYEKRVIQLTSFGLKDKELQD